MHTDREVTLNKPDIIIKSVRERENMQTDRCGSTCGQIYHAEVCRNKIKIQEITYRDTTNVGNEMYDYTGKKKKLPD